MVHSVSNDNVFTKAVHSYVINASWSDELLDHITVLLMETGVGGIKVDSLKSSAVLKTIHHWCEAIVGDFVAAVEPELDGLEGGFAGCDGINKLRKPFVGDLLAPSEVDVQSFEALLIL